MRTSTTSAFWHDRAGAQRLDGRLFIEGQRRAAIGGESFDARSPIDGRLLAQVARGRELDVDAAVRSARCAFEDGRWRGQSPVARKSVLLRFAQAVESAAEELALIETLDVGKPISTALKSDVAGAVRCLRWYAEAVDKIYGEIAPTGPDALALVTREPMGVIGCIVPWNYPMLMAAWKLAPALAVGNSVVLKPSEKSSLTAMRLAELAVEAGLPSGVFNVVTGLGPEAGEALARHLDVDAIGFTGSTRTGRHMLACAAESNLKRVHSELGGKSAALVFSDCQNPKAAAQALAETMFCNAGQSCNAPSRLLVQRSIVEGFLDELRIAASAWTPGDPLDPGTTMGAIVDEAQLDLVLGHVHAAREAGAHLMTGGARVRRSSGGTFIAPTIFERVDPSMRLAREEVFGPVCAVMTFEDEAEAVRIANDSPYGLQASVWSGNVHCVHRVARALRAGTVHVNQYNEDDMTVPFGGYKQSGNGRDKSLHALEKYTELKTTWLRIEA